MTAGRADGYSVVLFGPHGAGVPPSAGPVVEQARAIDGVSSVQISFHEDRDAAHHSMPPGGFRLAVINAWTLDAGRAAREILRGAAWG